jgi:hypothetical protein
MAKDIVRTSINKLDFIKYIFRLAYSSISRKRFRRRSFSTSSLSSINTSISNANFIYSTYTVRTTISIILVPSVLHVFTISSTVSYNVFNSKYFNRNFPDILSFVWSIFNILLSNTLSFNDFVLYKSEWINQFWRLITWMIFILSFLYIFSLWNKMFMFDIH